MKRIRTLLIFVTVLCLFCISGCAKENAPKADKQLTVTLLNGEHYTVIGENKKTVQKGGSAEFSINLEREYYVSNTHGDDCTYTYERNANSGLTHTVIFNNIQYKSTVRLETVKRDAVDFSVLGTNETGIVTVDSALGSIDDRTFFEGDILGICANPTEGYRFLCWSVGDYLNEGGSFYSYDAELVVTVSDKIKDLYANFKSTLNSANTLIYRFDNGVEIEQDCTQMLSHHPRANTFTAVDIRDMGIDCDSRMLVGWATENGEHIGLGSRVETSPVTSTLLVPVWKSYTPYRLFEVSEQGGILSYTDEGAEEVVLPRKIGDQVITSISEEAFNGCTARSIYLPDTISEIKNNAFRNCFNLTDFYMSDNVYTVNDSAFTGCRNLTTLHLNAFLRPKFAYESEMGITDLYDAIARGSSKPVSRFVVLGGSSVQYGYSVTEIKKLLATIEDGEKYEVYNLGWNADYCGLAQFQIISSCLHDGDIFLHAPEHYSGALCGYLAVSPYTGEKAVALTDGASPYVFRLCESNWDLFTHVKVNDYSNVFSMFQTFNRKRADRADGSYSDYYNYTPDGSLGLHQFGGTTAPEGGEDISYGAGARLHDWEETLTYTKRLIWSKVKKGVKTFITFPPVNELNLLETYKTQENVENAATNYTQQIKEVASGTTATVLLSQNDTIYAAEHFYGHDYHLGAPFCNTHTGTVLSALIQTLALRGALL